ncbi:maleylpyruvate isomerase N-terminal domain-containing protein [Gordonia hankookensis]|uniref:Maleylpyruvate isomerase N-terminal domain-containing protein n=1 Tax=Gordonia hankookensis TaxID=589403 RepID=A0ABR7W8Z9_9ACTN|nr:maleylpyruvate isomerase N-terminal domain-containing protein [Gordonia hankookensis]MBD1319295.1 maleylpyruvate isomerase N-terminal domain-containing protein [Gordonia hankookensis]
MTTFTELHRRALTDADDMIDALTSAMMPNASRCVGWTIEDLVCHMVGQNFGFADAIADGDADRSAYRPRSHTLWDESRIALTTAIDGDPAGEVRLVEITDEVFPLDAVLAIHTLDLAVHVWDALGDAYRPSPDIVELVLAQAERIPTDRGADAVFGPVRDVVDGDAWHRALGLLGRSSQTSGSSPLVE